MIPKAPKPNLAPNAAPPINPKPIFSRSVYFLVNAFFIEPSPDSSPNNEEKSPNAPANIAPGIIPFIPPTANPNIAPLPSFPKKSSLPKNSSKNFDAPDVKSFSLKDDSNAFKNDGPKNRAATPLPNVAMPFKPKLLGMKPGRPPGPNNIFDKKPNNPPLGKSKEPVLGKFKRFFLSFFSNSFSLSVLCFFLSDLIK